MKYLSTATTTTQYTLPGRVVSERLSVWWCGDTCESHLGEGDDDREKVGGDGPTEGGRESRHAVQDHHTHL